MDILNMLVEGFIRLVYLVTAIILGGVVYVLGINIFWKINYLSLKNLTPEEEKTYWRYRLAVKSAKSAVLDAKNHFNAAKDRIRTQRQERVKNTRKERKRLKSQEIDI